MADTFIYGFDLASQQPLTEAQQSAEVPWYHFDYTQPQIAR